MMKRLLTGAAALGLLAALAGPAHAQPQTAAPQEDQAEPDEGPMGSPETWRQQRMCENTDARMAAMLAFAETKLGITDAQRQAWTRFTQAARASNEPFKRLCDQLANQPAPATLPDRLARLEQIMSARLTGLQQLQPAVAQFYNSLTPEQKQVADQMMMMMMGHHWR